MLSTAAAHLPKDAYPDATWVSLEHVFKCPYMTYPANTQVKMLVRVSPDGQTIYGPIGAGRGQWGTKLSDDKAPQLPPSTVILMCGSITDLKRKDFSQFVFTTVLQLPPPRSFDTGAERDKSLFYTTSTDYHGDEYALAVKLLWYGWIQAQQNYYIPNKYPPLPEDCEGLAYQWQVSTRDYAATRGITARLGIVRGFKIKTTSEGLQLHISWGSSLYNAVKDSPDSIQGGDMASYDMDTEPNYTTAELHVPIPAIGSVCLIFGTYGNLYYGYYPLLGPYDLLYDEDKQPDSNIFSWMQAYNKKEIKEERTPFFMEWLENPRLVPPEKRKLFSSLYNFHHKFVSLYGADFYDHRDAFFGTPPDPSPPIHKYEKALALFWEGCEKARKYREDDELAQKKDEENNDNDEDAQTTSSTLTDGNANTLAPRTATKRPTPPTTDQYHVVDAGQQEERQDLLTQENQQQQEQQITTSLLLPDTKLQKRQKILQNVNAFNDTLVALEKQVSDEE